MGCVEYHHVVKALAAQGADEALDIGILPWRPRCDLHLVDPPGLDLAGEYDPVDRIAVAQEVSRGSVPRERLDKLLAVHWAVGPSVTLTWTTRRRSCARTTKTNQTLNMTVGTIKKSTATR